MRAALCIGINNYLGSGNDTDSTTNYSPWWADATDTGTPAWSNQQPNTKDYHFILRTAPDEAVDALRKDRERRRAEKFTWRKRNKVPR